MNKAEVWLRGPLNDFLPELQPAVHALLQAQEEVNELMKGFSSDLLFEKPAGCASVAFHLQHMAGVLDRLLTYASGKLLSAEQLEVLAAEGKSIAGYTSLQLLLDKFNDSVSKSIEQIKSTQKDSLFEIRGVGRAQIPSTVIGLMVHAAEHTMRHLGQLLVTARVVQYRDKV
ncbi:MAG: DinB family protein [Chitinophagaceae bacterium]